MLLEFNFEVIYRDGKSNTKADALTRQADSRPTDADNKRVKYQDQILLDPTLFVAATDFNVPSCYNILREATAYNEDAQKVIQAIVAGDNFVDIGNWKITLINARLEDGFVIINKRIWVPASCTKDVILEVYS